MTDTITIKDLMEARRIAKQNALIPLKGYYYYVKGLGCINPTYKEMEQLINFAQLKKKEQ